MTFALFLDIVLVLLIGWHIQIGMTTRRLRRRYLAMTVEMEEMLAKMHEQLPDVLRQLAELPGQAEGQLGQLPTAVVTVAFSPDATAVLVLSPATGDGEEVVEELDRYWANRAREALATYE